MKALQLQKLFIGFLFSEETLTIADIIREVQENAVRRRKEVYRSVERDNILILDALIHQGKLSALWDVIEVTAYLS